MEIKGKLIYCTKHKRNFYVDVETTDYVKLLSCRKDVLIDRLQYSRSFFLELLRIKQLIISN